MGTSDSSEEPRAASEGSLCRQCSLSLQCGGVGRLFARCLQNPTEIRSHHVSDLAVLNEVGKLFGNGESLLKHVLGNDNKNKPDNENCVNFHFVEFRSFKSRYTKYSSDPGIRQ